MPVGQSTQLGASRHVLGDKGGVGRGSGLIKLGIVGTSSGQSPAMPTVPPTLRVESSLSPNSGAQGTVSCPGSPSKVGDPTKPAV